MLQGDAALWEMNLRRVQYFKADPFYLFSDYGMQILVRIWLYLYEQYMVTECKGSRFWSFMSLLNDKVRTVKFYLYSSEGVHTLGGEGILGFITNFLYFYIVLDLS